MSLASNTLDDMCELIIDCPHFTPEWTTSGYLVIRNQNIRDGRLDLSERSYTHLEDFERRIRRAKPQAGDIIFTREAPMGEVCLVPEGLECCVGQRQVLLRPARNVDHRYFGMKGPARQLATSEFLS
jgi:type I restriction enzyme, S subunit